MMKRAFALLASSALLALLTLLTLLAYSTPASAQLPACGTPNVWQPAMTTCDGPGGSCPTGHGWGTSSFDSDTNEIVKFGGSGSSYLSETWTFSVAANRWSLRRAPTAGALCATSLYNDLQGPCRRDNHNQIYDPILQRHWLFNGTPYENCQPDCLSGFQSALLKAGIWQYDRTANSWAKFLSATGALHRRVAPGLAYDPVVHGVVEFGGDGNAGVKFDTTHKTDLTTGVMTLISPTGGTKPPAVNNLQGCFVYIAHARRFLLFGGQTTSGVSGQTWEFNPDTNTWVNLTSTIAGIPTAPTAREKHACAYHPPTGKIVMWNGEDVNDAPIRDTWILDYDASPKTWTRLCTGTGCALPAQRYMLGHYVPSAGRFLSSGGLNASKICSSGPTPGIVCTTNANCGSGGTCVAYSADVWQLCFDGGGAAPTFTPTSSSTPTNTPVVTPTPTRTVTPLPTETPTTTPTVVLQIALTPRSWKRVTPQAGHPNPLDQEKHTRNVFNPLDGKIYTISGDWTTGCTDTTDGNCVGTTNGSYRNDILSYTVATNTWTHEGDYCTYPNIQPQRPDYNGVAFDSLRGQFWMHGGYQDGATDGCTNKSYVRNQLMWWNPLSKLWAGPDGRRPMSVIVGGTQQALIKSAIYDSVSDALWWPHQDGRPGVLRYDPAADYWTRYRFDGPSTCDNDARFGDVGLAAFDPVGRIVYVLEHKNTTSACPSGGYKRLWKINIGCLAALGIAATNEGMITGAGPLACLAYETLPISPIAIRAMHDHERVVWDSVSGVLLYPYSGSQVGIAPNQFQFSVWTPPAGYPVTWDQPGSWEVMIDYANGIEPVVDPPGECPTLVPTLSPTPTLGPLTPTPTGPTPTRTPTQTPGGRGDPACSDNGSGVDGGKYCCLLRGNALAFDPSQNVFVLHGTARRDGVAGAKRYVNLYRHGIAAPTATATIVTATPTRTATPTHTATGTPPSTFTPTVTLTPTITPTPTPTPTISPTPTATNIPCGYPTLYPWCIEMQRICKEVIAECSQSE